MRPVRQRPHRSLAGASAIADSFPSRTGRVLLRTQVFEGMSRHGEFYGKRQPGYLFDAALL